MEPRPLRLQGDVLMYYLLGPSTRRQSPFLLCGQKDPKFVRTDRAKHDENAEERTRRYAREHTARSHAKTAASSATQGGGLGASRPSAASAPPIPHSRQDRCIAHYERNSNSDRSVQEGRLGAIRTERGGDATAQV